MSTDREVTHRFQWAGTRTSAESSNDGEGLHTCVRMYYAWIPYTVCVLCVCASPSSALPPSLSSAALGVDCILRQAPSQNCDQDLQVCISSP